MAKHINGKTNKQIAKDTGLHEAEISMALSCKRLLNREKLRKIVEAGYSLYPFVFGRGYKHNYYSKKESNKGIINE